jgi:hypothetical protein
MLNNGIDESCMIEGVLQYFSEKQEKQVMELGLY